MHKGQLISLAIGLAAGNFVWQFFTGQHYSVALERSYYQAIALALVYFLGEN